MINCLTFLMTGNLFTEVQLQKLRKDLNKSRKAAYAESTSKNLKTQWKSFLLFCIHFNLEALPTSLDTVCLYAQFLSRSFKTVDSIRNYLSGVKLMHPFSACPYPDLSAFDLKLALRGLKRLKPHCPKQALPITPSLLLQFFQFLDMDNPYHATLWCLFLGLFAFFLMLRKSNLDPLSKTQVDLNKILSRGIIFI